MEESKVKLKKLMSSMTLVLVVSAMLSACGGDTATVTPVAPAATATKATTAATATTASTSAPTATTAAASDAPKDDRMVDTAKFKKAGPYKMGFSNISVVNSWRVQMVRELEQEKTLHSDVSDLFITDAGGDVNKQIADVEDLLSKGIDALLITPASPDALVPVVQKALDAGIPVVVFNSSIAGDIATASIGTDETEFGYVIAKWLMGQIGCKGQIIALDGIAGNSISADRFNGLQKAINECADPTAIKILSRTPADWPYAKRKIATEHAHAAYPQSVGVWSQGGAMPQGAMEVFQAAGRKLVLMTGDDNNGFMKLWKKLQPAGFKGIAASEPTWLSGSALNLALDALNGKPVPHKRLIPVPTITDANLDQYVKPDLSDDYWANSKLPADVAAKFYANK